jgi:hypothetical protein
VQPAAVSYPGVQKPSMMPPLWPYRVVGAISPARSSLRSPRPPPGAWPLGRLGAQLVIARANAIYGEIHGAPQNEIVGGSARAAENGPLKYLRTPPSLGLVQGPPAGLINGDPMYISRLVPFSGSVSV